MTVGELGERMSAHELAEWRALYSVEADERREDQIQRDADAALDAERRKPLLP